VGSQPDIIGELYRHSVPRLGAFAYLLTGNHSEAEELVQAAIVKVFSRPRRIPDLPSAEAYVRATIRTIHLDGLRRQQRWRRIAPRLVPDAVLASPADALAARDQVGEALATLPPRVRAVVAMFYGDDLSVAQIAHELRVSEGTVKGYLRDGREALAPLLGADDSEDILPVKEARP
jgi:RNA polymerase sigma factor (sigma-70 family)